MKKNLNEEVQINLADCDRTKNILVFKPNMYTVNIHLITGEQVI